MLMVSFTPIMYAITVCEIKSEIKIKRMCLEDFFRNLEVEIGSLFNLRWAGASPSIQYSIFLNTISINNVCGHIQPHHTLPKTTVKRIMKTKKVINVMARITKS